MRRPMNRIRIISVLSVGVMVIGLGVRAEAGPVLYSIEDLDVRNDGPQAGGGGSTGAPNAVNNRSDFFEVRNLASGTNTIRRRIGYVKFDISGIDPSLFPTATISFSFSGGKRGSGVMSVYGLVDSAPNADSSFTEANWFAYHDAGGNSTTFSGVPVAPADGLSYSKGLGVDVSVPASDFTGNLGIDPAEATLLGVINVPGAVNDMVSNTVDLPLGAFLSADTNGFVTFLFADNRNGSPSTEWRITSSEYDASHDDANFGTALNFVPEPATFVLLAIGALFGLPIRRT
jgi:hypothetical protein